ncbi:septum formation initiator family protein [Lactobacillus sp. DCY120]|uniref:Septum formation initiator family protein n=1 Tax=Bombilactobacillus apium TaxID=2675299 RepID=A0A850QZT9_9LACO|nr:septum formation initiator family protein [Bombilactobacillus apium]NVY96309.1 septum formation initiator family protein [Bombilactobacillus apium]
MPRLRRSQVKQPLNLDNADLSAETQFKQRVQKVHRRRLGALALLGTLVFAFLGGHIYQAYAQKQTFQAQLVQQKHQLQATRKKGADLKVEIQQLHDPDYLDDLIRYRFNYSKDNETIYNLPGSTNQNLNF